MPRARTGLGHGLEALVSTREGVTLNQAKPAIARDAAAEEPTAPTAASASSWSYATLQRQRRKRRKLVFAAGNGCAGGIEATSIRGVGLLAALNALGGEGWELIGIAGKKLYLKRQRPMQ